MEHGGTKPTEDALKLSERELRSLLDVGRALVSELDVEVVLRRVLDTARELTDAEYAALGIIDEAGAGLERFLFIGLDEDDRHRIGPLPRGRGVLGELIRNPAPLRLDDVTTHPRSYGFPAGHPPMRTFLGVPIAIRGEAFGNLYLTDKRGAESFSPTDEGLVMVLAEWAAIAIDNACLYGDVERRRTELERAVRGLEATADVARAVGVETHLERVLELVVKRGRAMLDAGSLAVLLDGGSGRLRVAAAAGEIDSAVVGATVASEDSLASAVFESGQAQRVHELGSRPGHGLDLLDPRARAALLVPLGYRGEARGLLVAFPEMGNERGFGSDDEHLLISFAASAAIAIATAQSVAAERVRSSMRAADEERKRWARDLHDETLQELGAVKLLLEAASAGLEESPAAGAAAQAVEQLDMTIGGLQSLIHRATPRRPRPARAEARPAWAARAQRGHHGHRDRGRDRPRP
jgi:GAF domain-containing protein